MANEIVKTFVQFVNENEGTPDYDTMDALHKHGMVGTEHFLEQYVKAKLEPIIGFPMQRITMEDEEEENMNFFDKEGMHYHTQQYSIEDPDNKHDMSLWLAYDLDGKIYFDFTCEGDPVQFFEFTKDPVPGQILISNDEYYYYGAYPIEMLTPEAYAKAKEYLDEQYGGQVVRMPGQEQDED